MTNGSPGPAALVDTNVVVYAYDPRDEVKQRRAIETLRLLALAGSGAVSLQILGEFFWIATRKLPAPLSLADAEWNVRAFLRTWTVYEPRTPAVVEAIRGTQDHRLPYWDSLIWATAKLNGVPNVLSEDFGDGQMIEGVRFLNPFSDTFDLSAVA